MIVFPRHFCLYVLLSSLLSAPSLFGQAAATDAAMEGFVKDTSGAVVPSARVTARNLDTNASSASETNDLGYYRFPLLPIGRYELSVSAPGFSEYKQTGIILNVGRQVKIDVVLKVGAPTETVTVNADASILETGQTAVEEVITERALRALPVISRNIYNIGLLAPGVKGVPSSSFGTTQLAFGGMNNRGYNVDGLDNTQRRLNIRLMIHTPEALQEMQVVSNAFSAEFGRTSGGAVNAITRSGTNEYHGSVLLLNRPQDLSARPPLSATKPESKWEDYAFTLGGPVKKDRIFFFANYEYNPLDRPTPVTITSANAKALGLSADQLGNAPAYEKLHSAIGKMDFRLSNKNSGFVRYSNFRNVNPPAAGGLTVAGRGVFFEDFMNGVGAQWASIISPTLLNEFRYGMIQRKENRTAAGNPSPASAYINILGVANLGANLGDSRKSQETSQQLINNITFTRGIQTWKAGIDFQTTGIENTAALLRQFSFQGLAAASGRGAVSPLDQYLNTVAGAVDPATGRPYSYTLLQQDFGDPYLALRFNTINWFVQSELRLRQNLVVNLGLRYQLILFPVLDEQAPYELSREINNDFGNFAPRVGISYSPGWAKGKTVIRGGWGMFYDTTTYGLIFTAAQNNGRRLTNLSIPGTDSRAPRFPNLLPSANPAFGVVPNVTAFAPDFQVMYAHQGNLQIEQALTSNLSLNLQYNMAAAHFAPHSRDTNLGAPASILADGRPVFRGSAGRPDSRFRAINLIESGGNSSFHALDLTFTKRFSAGLQFNTTYSWSHALADHDAGWPLADAGTLMDATNRRRDYGNSSTDQRHRFVLQGLYAPKYAARGLRWINGFEFSSMTFMNSGFPINIQAGADLNLDLVLNDRPLYVNRNSLEGPGLVEVGFRVARRFVFRDRYNLELIAEAENLLNRLNANCNLTSCTSSVVNRAGAADFGRIVSSRLGRQFQIGFRFSF